MSDPTSDTAGTTGAQTETSFDSLPEVWRNEITSLRNENASARVKKNEAIQAKSSVEQQLNAALEQAQGAAYTQAQVAAKNVELLKIHTAIKVGVPTDKLSMFAELLQGDDEQALTSKAENLKALMGNFDSTQPPVDHSQGSGNVLPLNGDKLLNALTAMVNK